MPTVAALVPVRHHSMRVPGKNYRDFASAPRFTWIVRALRECPRIGQVVIDTDSPAVRDITRTQFPVERFLAAFAAIVGFSGELIGPPGTPRDCAGGFETPFREEIARQANRFDWDAEVAQIDELVALARGRAGASP